MHIWRPLWGKGVRQKWDVIGRRGWRVSACFGHSIFIYFLLKNIGFAPWPNIKLSQTLIYYCILFHWQFLITYSGFWLINILLGKFDTSSKKEMKMIKSQFFKWKLTIKCQESVCKYEVTFLTVNSPHWPVM